MKYRNLLTQPVTVVVSALFVCCLMYCLMQSKQPSLMHTQKAELSETISDAESRVEGIAFNEEEKKAAVIALVNRAADFFKKNRVVTACHAFSHTNDFIDGEVYVYVMDLHGVFLAHGLQQELIWQNYMNYKDSLGTSIAQQIIKKAREGGGWVTYEWRGASKISYVQLVEKEGKEFILAAGYYPHSKQDTVVNLVKGAVEVVKKDIDEGRPIEQAFSTIEYRRGRFIIGDLYLYAMRFDGLLLANGDDPKLVNTNSLEYQDSRGIFTNKEIIQKLKEKPVGEGIWVEYMSHRALKKAYAEKILDTQGVEYFIACGYYPESDREKAADLVRKGFQFMKSHGLSQAVKEFSRGARKNEFIYGDIGIVVYDLKGVVIADQNKSIIGQNQLGAVDEDNRHYVQEIIKKAQDGGGWIDFKINKLFKSFYVEQVDLGVDTYVIGAAFFPSSKQETMTLLAKSAVSYLEANTLEVAFAQFVDPKSRFIRGDLFVSVFDLAGNCYAYGSDVEKIWDTLLTVKDDEGKPYVKMLIDASQAGPANITYRMHKRPVIAHVERVEKEGTVFVVSSSLQT
jgi:cytochrome c